MIVEPTFFDHWKTKMLEAILGEKAPLYVLRLWGYCQDRREWEFENIPDGGIAAICRFSGDASELLNALAEVRFIERENGLIRVRNWQDYNATLVAAWENGRKGGRPRKLTQPKPTGNPAKTQRKPTVNPELTHREPTANPPETPDKPTGNRLDKTRVEEKKKEKKKSATAPRDLFLSIWNSDEFEDLRDDETLRDTCLEFIDHREAMKPAAKMTGKAVEMMLRDLRKVSPHVASELMQDAMRNGTRGWYWPDKAERFARQKSAVAAGEGGWEPRNPLLDDDGPDPWKI